MTSKERLVAAFRREEVDRVPVLPETDGIKRRLLGVSYYDKVTKGEVAAECEFAWYDFFDIDEAGAYFDTCVLCEGFGQELIYLRDEPPYPDPSKYVITSPDDYGKLERFDIETTPRLPELHKAMDIVNDRCGEKMLIGSLSIEPFVTLGFLRGMEQLLADCVRYPEEVMAALDVVTDMEIEFCRTLWEHGNRWFMLCHDYGNGSIMSEKMWLRLEADNMRRLQNAIKDMGAYLLIHNCSAKPYVDAAFELTDFDGYCIWSLPAGMSGWSDFKEKYGDKVAVNGVWKPTDLGHASYEEVKARSKAMIKELGPTGFILGPGCEFPADGSMWNVKALVDASKEAGA